MSAGWPYLPHFHWWLQRHALPAGYIATTYILCAAAAAAHQVLHIVNFHRHSSREDFCTLACHCNIVFDTHTNPFQRSKCIIIRNIQTCNQPQALSPLSKFVLYCMYEWVGVSGALVYHGADQLEKLNTICPTIAEHDGYSDPPNSSHTKTKQQYPPGSIVSTTPGSKGLS